MEKTAGLRDARLLRRLDTVTRMLEKAPSLSFPQMCDGSELEALYRFFGNPKVTPEAILAPHFEEVCQLARAEEEVLILHDTTWFSFATGDGSKREGFFGHFALTLSTKGYRRPLGVPHLHTWMKGDMPNKQARWFDGVTASAQNLQGANPIHVMDREADDYALLSQLSAGGHRFVIRLTHKTRSLAGADEGTYIQDTFARIERSVDRKAKLSKRMEGKRRPPQKEIHPSRNARIASLAVGATHIELKRPKTHHRHTELRRSLELAASLPLNIVRVWEPEPPEGEPPVEWVLVTTEPIDTLESIERIVDHYRSRWTIEEYFKAIKTGCAYEKRQLGDYEGLCNALATFIPIACRALVLRSEARDNPDQPAIQLQSDEMEVLRRGGRRKLPPEPTNRDVLLAIAALGGHIKWSGNPGWLTISRGLQQLETLVTGWRLAKLQQSRDQR